MNRSFEMYQYRQILLSMRQGDSDRDIARTGIMGRKKLTTVRQCAQQQGWLDPTQPLPDDRQLAVVFSLRVNVPANRVSMVEPFRNQVTAWFEQGIQGTTIFSALQRQHDYQGSYSSIARFLQQLSASRPLTAKSRLEFSPGSAAQVDFGQGPLITDVHTGECFKTWVFVMTLCWSRHQYAELVRDQSSRTWLRCHRHAFEWFGDVVTKVTIDNAKCAITRACVYDPEVQRAYAEWCAGHGVKLGGASPLRAELRRFVSLGVSTVRWDLKEAEGKVRR